MLITSHGCDRYQVYNFKVDLLQLTVSKPLVYPSSAGSDAFRTVPRKA